VLYIKLGGSLITPKKEGIFSIKESVVRSISSDLRDLLRDHRLFLAHGAGPFGHIPVKKHGLSEGMKAGSEMGVSETLVRMSELNLLVSKIMLEESIPVIPFPPRAVFRRSSGAMMYNLSVIERFMRLGLIPLTHGDLIPDDEKGVYVLSADEIPIYITLIGLEKVIFLTDVPGVLDAEGNLIREIGEGDVPDLGSEGSDVTGAMAGKLSAAFKLANMGVEVRIAGYLSEGDLKRAAQGEWGTKVTV